MLLNKKNKLLSPIIAKILEKKTMYGSLVTEKIAGTLSTAKTRSLNSTTSKTRNKGVINFFFFIQALISYFKLIIFLFFFSEIINILNKKF